MIVKAYAKINIALNVKNKREDGFHELDSVMLPIELHDSIEISILPPTYKDSYIVCDDFTPIPSQYNLAHIAIEKARKIYGFKENFSVHIHKSIPMGSGLGGGSSDAAAVLYAIFQLLKVKSNTADLLKIAEEIGSDVPFFMFNLPARVKGRGEKILVIDVLKKYKVLIVKPQESLSTKEIYDLSDKMEIDNQFDIDAVIEALNSGDDKALASSIGNSLYKPAASILPKITDTINKLKDFGFEIVSMSGSGSSVFALTENKHLLNKAEDFFYKKGYFVERTQLLL